MTRVAVVESSHSCLVGVELPAGAMCGPVTAIEGASLQLNAFFPIVGLVAFIVALQIAILARWR